MLDETIVLYQVSSFSLSLTGPFCTSTFIPKQQKKLYTLERENKNKKTLSFMYNLGRNRTGR